MNRPIFTRADICRESGYQHFIECIQDLIEHEIVLQLHDYGQHLDTTRYQHSLNVAYLTYRLCRSLKLNYKEAVRAALLHDLFFYDWREHKDEGWHPAVHPKKALEAAQSITAISPLMADGIVKHMWPLTPAFPKYKESWIITISDKVCATGEVIQSLSNRLIQSKIFIQTALFITFLHIS